MHSSFAKLLKTWFYFKDEIEDSMQATPRVRRSSQVAKAQDTSKDVANCFGFDDDEDDEEDDEDDK